MIQYFEPNTNSRWGYPPPP